MQKPLAGRVAIVTGGSRGLGAAFARGLAASGAKVALTSRDKARAQVVVDELLATGAEAVAVQAEMRSRASVNAAVEAATQALGPIDILVNNAGTCVHAPLSTSPKRTGSTSWRPTSTVFGTTARQ